MRETLETFLGVSLMLVLLHGCAAVTEWADQCDRGKWQGYDHAARCSAYLAERR